jgi:Flagellin and related hook-associated proteins
LCSGALGLGGLSVLIRADADAAIGLVDDAIRAVSSQRSSMGALQNRLEHTINNLATTAENLQAAESRIRDADIAQAMMEFVRYQILTQVSVAVMAQARASAQAVLRLLWP